MDKEAITSILKKNYNQYKKIIMLFSSLFVVIIVFYFISESYRINIVLNRMKVYNSILTLKSTNFKEKDKHKLSDYYIASSFRSVIGKNQMFDYCSTRILENVIRSGARFVWLDIFNSDLSDRSHPVVSNGYREGSWQLTLNSVTFDDCCSVISKTAFKSGKVNNYDDPLFIALNLNTHNNLNTLTQMKNSILKHLGTNLLGIEYGYNKINIGNIEMSKLCGGDNKTPKVVILVSGGFENSDLEELVNYSWVNTSMRKIIYKSIDPNIRVTDYPKENTDTLKNTNTSSISIITPEENTLFTKQYEPMYSWDIGCHFVCMYYQQPDKFMEQYINKFRTNSFVLKPPELRSKKFSRTDTRSIEMKQKEEALKSGDSNFSNCPLTNTNTNTNPKEDILQLKNKDSDEGMCFITSKGCSDTNLYNIIKYNDHRINVTIDETSRDLNMFRTGSVNSSEHNAETGSIMIQANTDLCCVRHSNIDIKDKLVLSPSCISNDHLKGEVGLKISTKNREAIKKYFTEGKNDQDFLWIHPKLCQVRDKYELDSMFCLLSRRECPNNFEEFETENKYKLCCKK